MAYDPQRKHERRRVTEEDGPAPVDELLGESPAAGNGERASTTPTDPSASAERAASPPEPAAEPFFVEETVEFDSGPDRRLLVVGFTLLVIAILLLSRRRRRRRADEAA